MTESKHLSLKLTFVERNEAVIKEKEDDEASAASQHRDDKQQLGSISEAVCQTAESKAPDHAGQRGIKSDPAACVLRDAVEL